MDSKGSTAYVTIVQALSLLVLCVVMVAGLWPFRAPRNAVSWLKSENGLRFGHHGTLISRDAFRLASPVDQGPCSLEIWLTPESVSRGGVILAFDSSPDASTPFSLRQQGSSVAIQRYTTDEQGTPQRPWLEVDGVFYEGKRTQITIASGTDGTTIYVNGVLAGGSSTLGVTSRDLTGRLVVGNSTVDESWSGEISRLAIYDRELLPAEVKRHFMSEIRESDFSGGDGPTALYLFNEREGMTVHNKMDPETDLLIPARYCVLHRALFRPLWDEFNDSGAAWRRWSCWKDIAVNVVGFIPVGFLFMAYFSSVKALRWSTLFVITLGFALSFTIEALQYFLPTRDSSISDLITNTTGTAVGVVVYRLPWVQRLVGRTRQYVTSSSHVGQDGITSAWEPTTTRHEV